MKSDQLTVALAQIAPIWLNRDATISKIIDYIHQAKEQNVDLIAFGEAVLPGYPFWIGLTDGARFNASDQKVLHAHYLDQAVQIEVGDQEMLNIQKENLVK